MSNLKLNETPVRTSRNFNINNIKLDDVQIPKEIGEFRNVEMTYEKDKIDVNQSMEMKSCELVYGLGEELKAQVAKSANQRLKITTNHMTGSEMQMKFLLDENNRQLVDQIEIQANEGTKATLVLQYETKQDIQAFHNGVLQVQAKKNANLHIILVNFMNATSNHFMSIENTLEENAKVNYTIIDFGGKNSITNYYSNLLGKSSNNILNTIYLGKENQLFDLNYIGELRGEKSNIDIQVEGALKDKAKKHFKGTIDFKKGCKKATGNENENCMLLSDTAKSLALPMLLCSEEEVEGNHSSSARKNRRQGVILHHEPRFRKKRSHEANGKSKI
ncbi:MAG: SufD family Fe-S cluster assembly protein [Clostridia bacterium]|nr:SufD family Fe-S cluster assembly protein [Clostridia bacterium]